MKRYLVGSLTALVLVGIAAVVALRFISPAPPPVALESPTVATSTEPPPPAASSGLLSTLFATSSAFAGTSTPALAWLPAQVTVTMAPGDTKTIQATVTAQSAVKSTAALVAPALTPFLVASPSTVSGLGRGATQTFTLTFAVPTSTPFQTVTGTFHLDVGKTTIARPLPIVVNVGQPLSGDHFTIWAPPSYTLTTFSSSTIVLRISPPTPEDAQEDSMGTMRIHVVPDPAALDPVAFYATKPEGFDWADLASAVSTTTAGSHTFVVYQDVADADPFDLYAVRCGPNVIEISTLSGDLLPSLTSLECLP